MVQRPTVNSMLDGILVGNPADVTASPLREEVSQSLIVHLYVRGLQLVLPALSLQHAHLLQDLQAHQPTDQAGSDPIYFNAYRPLTLH